jgi:hypothetical protein
MPIHDWSRVDAGIFHDFHHAWVGELKRAMNGGPLSSDEYAIVERAATDDGLSVALAPGETEADAYVRKANRIVVRQTDDHQMLAVIEIVSPGNKRTKPAIRTFAEKAAELLRGGVHLLVLDLFPPGPRDPQGIHKLIWTELDECNFVLPPDRPLTLASYMGGPSQEAFIEPIGRDAVLPDMPLFLSSRTYVPVPLEATYQSAWQAVPAVWKKAIERSV